MPNNPQEQHALDVIREWWGPIGGALVLIWHIIKVHFTTDANTKQIAEIKEDMKAHRDEAQRNFDKLERLIREERK